MTEINAADVKKLRDATGAGFMECKKALTESKGDVKKAEEWIRKNGLAKAEKLGLKEAKMGRIGCYVHNTGKFASVVELNCTTDFVANTDDFKKLLEMLCLHVVGAAPTMLSKADLPADVVEAEKAKYADEVKGKPAEIAAKIVEGKLEKNLYSQKCLLHQPYINDVEFSGSVGDLIKREAAKCGENIVIRRFSRYELGG